MAEFTLRIDPKNRRLYFQLPASSTHPTQSPWPGIFAEALAHADEQTHPPKFTPLSANAFRKKIIHGATPSSGRDHVAIALDHLPDRWSEHKTEFLESIRTYMIAERHIIPGDTIIIVT